MIDIQSCIPTDIPTDIPTVYEYIVLSGAVWLMASFCGRKCCCCCRCPCCCCWYFAAKGMIFGAYLVMCMFMLCGQLNGKMRALWLYRRRPRRFAPPQTRAEKTQTQPHWWNSGPGTERPHRRAKLLCPKPEPRNEAGPVMIYIYIYRDWVSCSLVNGVECLYYIIIYLLIKLSMLKTTLRRIRRFGMLTWMVNLRVYSSSLY